MPASAACRGGTSNSFANTWSSSCPCEGKAQRADAEITDDEICSVPYMCPAHFMRKVHTPATRLPAAARSFKASPCWASGARHHAAEVRFACDSLQTRHGETASAQYPCCCCWTQTQVQMGMVHEQKGSVMRDVSNAVEQEKQAA